MGPTFLHKTLSSLSPRPQLPLHPLSEHPSCCAASPTDAVLCTCHQRSPFPHSWVTCESLLWGPLPKKPWLILSPAPRAASVSQQDPGFPGTCLSGSQVLRGRDPLVLLTSRSSGQDAGPDPEPGLGETSHLSRAGEACVCASTGTAGTGTCQGARRERARGPACGCRVAVAGGQRPEEPSAEARRASGSQRWP